MIIKQSVPVELEVTEPPAFFLEVVPLSVKSIKGVMAVYQITVTPLGPDFVWPVTLERVGLPPGAVSELDKPFINAGQTATLTIKTEGIAVGKHPFSIEGSISV